MQPADSTHSPGFRRLCPPVWLAVVMSSCSGADSRDDGGADGTGIAPPPATDGTATPTTGASDETSAGPTSSGAADDSSAGVPEIRFDLGPIPDAGPDCNVGGGQVDFSYIWIANSGESTVSKINTETMIEEGRYRTRPDSAGNPSRTSVNLNGDMVIANRNGGVTMIYARHEDCPDAANTSSGPGDVKPWPDGCVGWYAPMNYSSQRPVAWTAGTYNPATCRYDDPKVWTSGTNGSVIDVLLLDGATGTIEQTVSAPAQVISTSFGIYGGAVDSGDHFWGSQLNRGHLVRVDRQDFSVEAWPMAVGGYGMAVDRHDRVWTCAAEVGRFDYPTQTWSTAPVGGYGNGCMADGEDLLWIAYGASMIGVHIDTMNVAQTLPVPTAIRGISIDFAGYIWGPSIPANAAYRVDPATGAVETVVGLNFPYTYSDMTGFGLSQVGGPQL